MELHDQGHFGFFNEFLREAWFFLSSVKGFCCPGVVQFALACFLLLGRAAALWSVVFSAGDFPVEISLCVVIVATGKTHRKHSDVLRNCTWLELLKSLAPR